VRTVDTPDLEPRVFLTAKFSAEKMEKNVLESVEVGVSETELTVGGCVYDLARMKGVGEDCSLDLSFGEARLHLRFPTPQRRAEVESQLTRISQVGVENKLIEEADQVLQNYEETKLNTLRFRK